MFRQTSEDCDAACLAGTKTVVLSTLWVKTHDEVKISKIMKFASNKMYFTTTVTLVNTGATDITEVYYVRSVDPDQGQPWCSGNYRTNNYVLYQPPHDGDAGRPHSSGDPWALVVAEGPGAVGSDCRKRTQGLGTISVHAKVRRGGVCVCVCVWRT